MLVTLLKEHIPYFAREWDAENKRWLIDKTFEREVHSIMQSSGYRPLGEPKQVPPTPTPPQTQTQNSSAWQTLYLTPGAPPEVIEAAYRALIKKHHPDQPGGSEEKAKAINGAYQQLKGR